MVEKALPEGSPALPPEDLPAGFRAEWDPGVRRFDGGAVVVGGIPRRVIRLSMPAVAALDRLVGEADCVATPAPARLARPLLDAGLLHPTPGPADLGVGQVTVVVPVRDRAEALARMLPDLGGVGRVVVVDDASTDASAETAAAWGAEVVRRSSSGGPAAARNAGLARVSTPVVAFVDSDVRLEPGWLEGLLAHFNDPSVVLVAPRVIGDTAGRADSLARYEMVRSPVDLGPRPGYVRPGNRVSFLPAAVLVARTAVVRALGGFDEALQVGEDVDFVWRVGAAGWRVRYEPGTLAHHETRGDLRSFLRQRVHYGTSAAALHRRHPGKVAPIAVSPWSAALWAAALAGRLRLAGLLGLLTVGRLERRLRGRVGDSRAVAWAVAGAGHLGAARVLASALCRTWLPLALVALAAGRRPRRTMALFLAVPPLVDWLERRPALDPATYGVLHLADDAAYCAGVWLGCRRERTIGPLLPRLQRASLIFPEAGPDAAGGPGPGG